ncbi:hypothetical protein Vafri_19029, partial [Volvox africanus]
RRATGVSDGGNASGGAAAAGGAGGSNSGVAAISGACPNPEGQAQNVQTLPYGLESRCEPGRTGLISGFGDLGRSARGCRGHNVGAPGSGATAGVEINLRHQPISPQQLPMLESPSPVASDCCGFDRITMFNPAPPVRQQAGGPDDDTANVPQSLPHPKPD